MGGELQRRTGRADLQRHIQGLGQQQDVIRPVRREDDRQPLAFEIAQQLDQFPTSARIQIGGGLVEKQQIGRADQG